MCLGCPANSSLLLPLPFWIVREEITDDARSGEEEEAEAEEEEEEEATIGRQLADHRDHETRLLHTRAAAHNAHNAFSQHMEKRNRGAKARASRQHEFAVSRFCVEINAL